MKLKIHCPKCGESISIVLTAEQDKSGAVQEAGEEGGRGDNGVSSAKEAVEGHASGTANTAQIQGAPTFPPLPEAPSSGDGGADNGGVSTDCVDTVQTNDVAESSACTGAATSASDAPTNGAAETRPGDAVRTRETPEAPVSMGTTSAVEGKGGLGKAGPTRAKGTDVENQIITGAWLAVGLVLAGLILWRFLGQGLLGILLIFAGICAPFLGLLFLRGPCPYCGCEIRTTSMKARVYCEACRNSVLIGSEKFYRTT